MLSGLLAGRHHVSANGTNKVEYLSCHNIFLIILHTLDGRVKATQCRPHLDHRRRTGNYRYTTASDIESIILSVFFQLRPAIAMSMSMDPTSRRYTYLASRCGSRLWVYKAGTSQDFVLPSCCLFDLNSARLSHIALSKPSYLLSWHLSVCAGSASAAGTRRSPNPGFH